MQETHQAKMPSDQDVIVGLIAQQQIEIQKLRIANDNLAREARSFMIEAKGLREQLEALKNKTQVKGKKD